MPPIFPEFKPIELSDRALISDSFARYRPEISELTFTNLFIWRSYYGWEWSQSGDALFFVGAHETGQKFALAPVGPPPRADAVHALLRELTDRWGEKDPAIERADGRLASELSGSPDLVVQPSREHFDYVYRTSDLDQLAGRKYHSKRNFLNRFSIDNSFAYEPIGQDHVAPCLELAERWCKIRRCQDDMSLMGEFEAVKEALTHFFDFSLSGGVISINGKVEAFSLGEALNDDTAVIHVEKADPEIRGLYAVINHEFVSHALSGFGFVNREQDLGDQGLRKAKESYFPDHLVEKYRVALK